jgi:hypothetical protein
MSADGWLLRVIATYDDATAPPSDGCFERERFLPTYREEVAQVLVEDLVEMIRDQARAEGVQITDWRIWLYRGSVGIYESDEIDDEIRNRSTARAL